MITSLSQLIAMAESSNNIHASRFEPAFTPSDLAVSRCVAANKCTAATAKVICATSYGKYQILGEELYRREIITTPIFVYANDEAAQDNSFNVFIAQKHIVYTLQQILTIQADRDNFAHLYNGNAAAYGPYLLRVYAQNGGGQ
jgi:hypothetical protein